MEGSGKMQCFSIGIEEQNINDIVFEMIQKQNLDDIKIEKNEQPAMAFIDCYPVCHLSNHDLCVRLSNAVVDAIIDDIQWQIAERIVEKEYFYFDRNDRNRILEDTKSKWTPSGAHWKGIIWGRVYDHLNHNTNLIIDGFIRFRLKDFLKELENTIDRAVDDLLIEKEYNEFIKLLRYFVEIQEPKVEEVHVLLGGDKKYTLLDSGYREINNDILEDMAKEISDKDISYDDLLISSLITIAPNKIVIHDSNKIKNTELLNTINNVFSGKVEMKN